MKVCTLYTVHCTTLVFVVFIHAGEYGEDDVLCTTTEPLIGQKGQGKADDVIVYCKSILLNTFCLNVVYNCTLIVYGLQDFVSRGKRG